MTIRQYLLNKKYDVMKTSYLYRDLLNPVLYFILSVVFYYIFNFTFLSIIAILLALYIVYLIVRYLKGYFRFINKELVKKSFICPHCLGSVKMELLTDITCPFCKEAGKDYNDLVYGCSCGAVIQYISCPHCDKAINMFSEYDENFLRNRRYV